MDWPDYAKAWIYDYGHVFTDDILYPDKKGNILRNDDSKKSFIDDIYYSKTNIY